MPNKKSFLVFGGPLIKEAEATEAAVPRRSDRIGSGSKFNSKAVLKSDLPGQALPGKP
jgi:hypothetical protein